MMPVRSSDDHGAGSNTQGHDGRQRATSNHREQELAERRPGEGASQLGQVGSCVPYVSVAYRLGKDNKNLVTLHEHELSRFDI